MKTLKIFFNAIVIVTIIIILTNCEDLFNLVNKKSSEHTSLFSTKWIFKEIRHTDTKTIDAVPGSFREMNIVFSDPNRYRAYSSCNVFEGDFITSAADSIKIYTVYSTQLFCTDSIKRVWEDMFRQNLHHSCIYAIKDGTLSITTNINTVLIFK